MTPHNENFLTYSRGEDPNYLTPFARRVIFLGSGDYDGSIMIQNVTLSDEGGYLCIFTTFPSGLKEREIRLVTRVRPMVIVQPPDDPVTVGSTLSIVAICEAAAAKPAANISWITIGRNYTAKESTTSHANRTVTTYSQLYMVPTPSLYGHKVTCCVSQGNGTCEEQENVILRNIQYAPQTVHINVLTDPKGTPQLVCEADANPPVTHYSWTREKESILDGPAQGRSSVLDLSKADRSQINDLYICGATNTIGNLSGSIYIYYYNGSHCHIGVVVALLVVSIICNAAFVSYFYWLKKTLKNKETREENLSLEPSLL
ncbi:nectin-1-like isoform X2 [Ascaphus truei]